MTFTNNEIEVLQVLLDAKRPLTCAGIIEHSPNKTWKNRSIHLLINALLEKNVVEEAGFVRTGKTFGRAFAVSKEGQKAYLKEAIDFAGKVDTTELMSAVFAEKEIDIETINKLEKIIAKRRGELQ